MVTKQTMVRAWQQRSLMEHVSKAVLEIFPGGDHALLLERKETPADGRQKK
jgi:hypothetical protein